MRLASDNVSTHLELQSRESIYGGPHGRHENHLISWLSLLACRGVQSLSNLFIRSLLKLLSFITIQWIVPDMRFNKAGILSVCLLALRMGVSAAAIENINNNLAVNEDHNTTSVADGYIPLGNTGIEFPVPVAELERRKLKGGRKASSRKPSKTTKKKTKKKTQKKKKKPTKSKTANPKVTSKATLSPTKSKSVSKSASKTKSSKDPYGSCKPKKGVKGTKGKKTKGKKGVKREEEGFTPISDEVYHVRLFYCSDRPHSLTQYNRVSQLVTGRFSRLEIFSWNFQHIPLVGMLSV